MFFFQGTQSANPHNDYCQHFVDTGQRPHNFIRDVGESCSKTKLAIIIINKLNKDSSTDLLLPSGKCQQKLHILEGNCFIHSL